MAAQAVAFGVPWEEQPPPDVDLVPGTNLSFGGSEFEVLFAPGHAPGHVIFLSTSEPAAIAGDVVFDEVREVAGAISPVPGGVGPMTIAMLLSNTVDAAVRLHADGGRS